MSSRKELGDAGEEFAAAYLQSRDYEILSRNFRFGRTAEVDIIALTNDTIVFVEVKTRNNQKYGTPAEAVTLKKQQKIIAAATKFLQDNDFFDKSCRFDVIEVFADNDQNFNNWKYNHIENAFEIS
ncbi:MAG: YraN family protein [Selenomonadaceae bacterium]|nr:YraN family protein [Selenomonadaceae bacterium]